MRPEATARETLLAYVCLFLSGASALVYEVVWMRHLRLVTGATTAAVSTVLAVFMGGLALGAFLFGRVADKSRAPLRLYGYLEAAIGAYALLLPFLLRESAPIYVALASSAAGRPALLAGLRAALGAVLLLLPAVLMGGTLPVLVRCVGRDAARFGRSLGFLYALNLAGAVVGTVAAAFTLMPRLGIYGATLAAATVNLAIGAVCILSGARGAPAEATAEPSPPAPATPATTGSARPRLLAVIFFSGYASLGFEVLWTRILLFTFTSTVQAFAVILATFLTGLALGSGVFALVESRFDRWRTLAVVQSLAGALSLLFVPASLGAMRVMERLTGGAQGGEGAIVLAMAVSAALVILMPATLMGVVFPLASRILASDLARASHGIGRAYTVNTIGGVLGSLLTGFVAIPVLGLKNSLVLLAASQMALGWAIVPVSGFARGSGKWLVSGSGLGLAAALVAAVALLRGPNPFDQVPADTFLAHHDGVTASVSVVKDEVGGRALRIDGFEAAGDPGMRPGQPAANVRAVYMGLMTHIPMLLHPDPRRLLVICFGTGTTTGAGLAHPDAQVTAVDINATVFSLAGHFAEANRDVAHDPRARLVVDDGRNFLLTTRETFDVITSEPMPPRFAGVSSLYSREYYQLARQRLAPGGLLAQWLPFHLVSVAESWAILRTVQEVFPDTTLWVHYGTGIIVARRDAPVEIDVDGLRRRLAGNPLRADMTRFHVSNADDFLDLYMLGPSGVRRAVRGAPLVTDDRPLLEFHPSPYRVGALAYGSYPADQAAALEAVYRLQKDEPLPLRGVGAEATALAERHALMGHEFLGTLYMETRFWAEARREFEAGLARSTPEIRAMFVRSLAELVERQAAR